MITDMKHLAYIAVGSNMGDPAGNCREGINALDSHPECEVIKRSSMYRTSPMEYLDQEWFVNCAVEIRTGLDPLELLMALKFIEKSMGRKDSGVRYGPRVLDLDIVLYDDIIMETESLVIPHPKMDQRCFVLKPLCDLAPEMVHPLLKKKMRALLEYSRNDEQKVVEYKC